LSVKERNNKLVREARKIRKKDKKQKNKIIGSFFILNHSSHLFASFAFFADNYF